MRCTVSVLSLALLLFAGAASAQTFRGQLTGTIADPTGAVIPAAEVTFTNIATNITRKVASNERGIYLIPNIEPGQYRITAVTTGFKTFAQEPITVPVGGSLTLDITLEVGDMTERVTVSGEAPLLEGESASFGQVVGERSIREMPLNSRNPMILVALTPGVITTGDFSKDGIGAGGIEEGRDQYSADFLVGGGRPLHNEVLLDGAPNTSVDRGYMAYVPPVDSTQEFKVEANAFSAEYDRTTGGVVNLVTKGGTNEFHGTAFEFFRTSDLDANDFFFNRAGRSSSEKPSWRRNQFGANFGGPIVRNRTFFFANYEGLRQEVPFSFTSTVPTAAQRQGDFSQTRTSSNALITIYDPLTTVRSPSGALSRTPFAGNIIPPQRQDPAGLAVLNAYPAPNQPGDAFTNARNFFTQNNGKADMNNYGGRIDHMFGSVNRIFGRFSYRRDERTAANQYGEGHPALTQGGPTDQAYNITLSDIHTFSPSLTGELRASFARHHTREISPSYGFDQNQLKLPANYIAVAKPFFPKFNTADLTSMGRDRYYDQVRDTVAIQGHLTKLAGAHSMKAGFDFRVPRFHLDRNLNSAGTFAFNRGMTQGPDPQRATATGGFGAASLLLGAGASGNVTHTDVFSLNRKYYGIYFQDNWKLTPRFTLNLGIRYNLEVGQNESHDRMAYMDLGAPSPLAQQVGLPLTGVLRFAGGDNTRNLVATDKNNFAPRIGFAYRLTNKTAIRAGYGVFYSAQWISAYDTNVYPSYNSTSTWVASLDGLVPTNLLSNAFPQGFSLPKRDRDPLSNVGAAISGWIQNERVGYAQQWNLSIQRQFGSSTLIEAAYWANKGTKMENRSGWQENWLPNVHYFNLKSALNELVDNPFYGAIDIGQLSAEKVTRRQLLLPYPQYTSVIRTGPSAGNSIYHAFTLRVEKRFSQNLSLLASYTLSKQIDDFDARPLDQENRRLERSVSAFDAPQRLVMSYIYELPFGRGKAYGADLHPVLNAVAGGWSVSGITTFQSGTPVSVSRPSVNNGQSARLDNPDIDRWFDTSVFSAAEPFTFGNVGRLLPDVRGHGVKDFDIALGKMFPVGERYQLKFRGEFFNAMNTPRFGNPASGVTSATFGRVSAQRNRPRSVQFGLQFYW